MDASILQNLGGLTAFPQTPLMVRK